MSGWEGKFSVDENLIDRICIFLRFIDTKLRDIPMNDRELQYQYSDFSGVTHMVSYNVLCV